jgi:hypothetical protein
MKPQQAPEAKLMPKFSGPYKLSMKILSATLDRSTEKMGKMAPFVEIDFRGSSGAYAPRKWKSPTHKGGHKTPIWNFDIEFYYGGDVSGASNEDLYFTVFDEALTHKKLVGETGSIPINSFAGQGLK